MSEGVRWSQHGSHTEWSTEDLTQSKPLLGAKREATTDTRRLWKNTIALVVGIGAFTMGLNPIDDLQSSLNGQQGLGVASLTIKYATMIIGNLLTNTVLIRHLGSKMALVSGAILYGVYIIANFYPTWYTLIPLTLVSGFGGALMWTTLGNYLARLAKHHAGITGRDEDEVKALFFGLKGIAGYACAAIGGLVSSLVLGTGVIRVSDDDDFSRYQMCGIDYCNEDLNKRVSHLNVTQVVDEAPDMKSVYILCGFCLGAVVIAVVILIALVDPLPKLGIVEPKDSTRSSLWLLLATVSLWKNPKQLLLIPISFVYGFQEAFWRVEFTKSYITCAMGIEQIGYLMLSYNLASLAASFLAGFLGQRKKRWIAILLMASVDTGALVSLFFWKPTPNDLLIAFIISGVTGATYGGLSTLLLAFYGVVFSTDLESAYSNLYFWSFLASTLMYAWSFLLCLNIKLSVVLCSVVLGAIGYSIVEYMVGLDNEKVIKDQHKEVANQIDSNANHSILDSHNV